MKSLASDQISTASISLADIEAESKKAFMRPRFAPIIENLYCAYSIEDQHKSIALTWFVGLLLYDSFLVSDYFLAGDEFYMYFTCRIVIMTPICLLATYAVYKKSKFYEIWMCVIPISMSLALTYLLVNTHGDFRASYLFGDILLMMCGSVISRPRIVFTVVAIALQCLCFQSVMLLSDVIVPRDRIVSLLFSLSGGVVSIMTAYALEETSRRVFLLGLRVRLLNGELEIMAKTDPLTGLGNRRIFEEVVQRVWADRSRSRETAAVILIDLDHFKSFNDNYGHPAGDSCLQIIARCVKDALRDGDLGVRFGGEELLVLAPNADQASAHAIAETIRQAIRAAKIPHPAIGDDAFMTASFGVATSPIADCTATELVSRADIALYSAKRNGRNQIWPLLDGSDRLEPTASVAEDRTVTLNPKTNVTAFPRRSA